MMGEATAISWCDHTWSPWYGCTQVSMGKHGACVACYARDLSESRFHRVVFGGPGRGEGTRDVRADSAWKEPLRWQRQVAALERAWHAGPNGGMGRPYPYRPTIFPSMCDPFDNHPDLVEPRRRFFDLIRATPNLTWLLLTKRPGNIARLWSEATRPGSRAHERAFDENPPNFWPRNAAIGCTVVTQEEADRDVPKLLAAKAVLNPAFAFLSMEPLLGPVDLTRVCTLAYTGGEVLNALNGEVSGLLGEPAGFASAVDWVITGGETDQGKHRARPTHPGWFRAIRDQCAAAGVPYHHKQNGEWRPAPHMIDASGELSHRWPDGSWSERVGKEAAGRLLDGALHDARPVLA